MLALLSLLSFWAAMALAFDRELYRYQNIEVIEDRLFTNHTVILDKEVKCAAKCAVMEKGCDGYRFGSTVVPRMNAASSIILTGTAHQST